MPAATWRDTVATAFEGFATGAVTTAGTAAGKRAGLRKSNCKGGGCYYLVLVRETNHRQCSKGYRNILSCLCISQSGDNKRLRGLNIKS